MADVNEPIVSFRLPSEKWVERLDKVAEHEERSRAVVLRRAVQAYIEASEADQKKVGKK